MVEPVVKPRKDEHTLRLTSTYTRIAQRLAEYYEDSFSGMLTRACEIGLRQLQRDRNESQNKELMNRRLIAKEEGAMEFVRLFRDVATTPEQQAALDKLEQWLSKG
jgi:hypothetical protein